MRNGGHLQKFVETSGTCESLSEQQGKVEDVGRVDRVDSVTEHIVTVHIGGIQTLGITFADVRMSTEHKVRRTLHHVEAKK